MTATAKDVMERSVCLVLSFSRLSAKRTVGRGQIGRKGLKETAAGAMPVVVDADTTMVHVSRDILDSAELRAVVTHDSETRHWLVKRSLPAPMFRSGVHLYAVDMVEDACAFLERRRSERKPLVDAFLKAYPALVKDARTRLNDLFDAAQYPATRALAAAFDIKWAIIDWGTPDRKLRAISKALFEKERSKAEAEWASATEEIGAALAKGMAEVVGHLAESLAGGDGGEPKRFKQASVAKVEEFLEMFDKRNIVSRADLKALSDRAKRLLSGVDAKQLKADEKLRGRVAQGFGEIKASLDGMLEARPARRMTLADEEA